MQAELDRKKLRQLREQNNLTQEQLAERANISDRHLRAIETTPTNPSSEVLCRLCLALSVPMGELMIIK